MRLLLDTNILLILAENPERLDPEIIALVENGADTVFFSAVNIWEIAIKFALHRPDFRTRPEQMLQRFRAARYDELRISSEHALALSTLPPIHKDPFDRLLLAQAIAEDVTLLTTDRMIARYPGPIRLV